MGSKHIFSKQDINAIKAAAAALGGESELARRARINQPSSINNYVNGRSRSCTIAVWEKLMPVIKPYYQKHDSTHSVSAADKKNPEKASGRLLAHISSLFNQLAPEHRIVTGIINVHGVPNEKIIAAIDDSDLTEEQKRRLKDKIFS